MRAAAVDAVDVMSVVAGIVVDLEPAALGVGEAVLRGADAAPAIAVEGLPLQVVDMNALAALAAVRVLHLVGLTLKLEAMVPERHHPRADLLGFREFDDLVEPALPG